MATITTRDTALEATERQGAGTRATLVISTLGTLSTGDTIELTGLGWGYAHVFVSVKLYKVDGVALSTSAPSAGSLVVTALTKNNYVFEAIPDPTIVNFAGTPVTMTTTSWDGNTSGVRVVAAGFTGGDAIFFRVFITLNYA